MKWRVEGMETERKQLRTRWRVRERIGDRALERLRAGDLWP